MPSQVTAAQCAAFSPSSLKEVENGLLPIKSLTKTDIYCICAKAFPKSKSADAIKRSECRIDLLESAIEEGNKATKMDLVKRYGPVAGALAFSAFMLAKSVRVIQAGDELRHELKEVKEALNNAKPSDKVEEQPKPLKKRGKRGPKKGPEGPEGDDPKDKPVDGDQSLTQATPPPPKSTGVVGKISAPVLVLIASVFASIGSGAKKTGHGAVVVPNAIGFSTLWILALLYRAGSTTVNTALHPLDICKKTPVDGDDGSEEVINTTDAQVPPMGKDGEVTESGSEAEGSDVENGTHGIAKKKKYRNPFKKKKVEPQTSTTTEVKKEEEVKDKPVTPIASDAEDTDVSGSESEADVSDNEEGGVKAPTKKRRFGIGRKKPEVQTPEVQVEEQTNTDEGKEAKEEEPVVEQQKKSGGFFGIKLSKSDSSPSATMSPKSEPEALEPVTEEPTAAPEPVEAKK